MLPEERQSFIYSYLYQHAYVTFSALAQLLNVSHMTIRRDIQMLEKDGKVTIISGGAKLNEALKQELPWQEKAQLHHQSKRNIARVAEKLVESGQVIYLDAGTTTYEIARSIADQLKKNDDSDQRFHNWRLSDGASAYHVLSYRRAGGSSQPFLYR